MNVVSKLVLACTVLGAAAGCIAPPKYSWGNYDKALYGYYKDPAKQADYMTALEENVRVAEQANKRVAPGLYAEYGYMLMVAQRKSEAVTYFRKEQQFWPESFRFMEGMIKNAGGVAADAEVQAPVSLAGDSKK